MKRDTFAIDLSIDFDFFVREDPMWDFGHQDSDLFASSIIWNSRYAYIDLYRETSPLKYADFEPNRLVDKLADIFDVFKPYAMGWADSHARAVEFFASHDHFAKEPIAPGVLINIDAHHDGWARNMDVPEPLAENWALHLQKQWPETQFVQCYPKWKDPELDGPNAVERVLTFHGWEEFSGGMAALLKPRSWIRNVFICSSQSWVPPHHDKEFLRLLNLIAKKSMFAREMQGIRKRAAPTPKEADQMRAHHAEQMKQLGGTQL